MTVLFTIATKFVLFLGDKGEEHGAECIRDGSKGSRSNE